MAKSKVLSSLVLLKIAYSYIIVIWGGIKGHQAKHQMQLFGFLSYITQQSRKQKRVVSLYHVTHFIFWISTLLCDCFLPLCHRIAWYSLFLLYELPRVAWISQELAVIQNALFTSNKCPWTLSFIPRVFRLFSYHLFYLSHKWDPPLVKIKKPQIFQCSEMQRGRIPTGKKKHTTCPVVKLHI